jgi:hypothetical protein
LPNAILAAGDYIQKGSIKEKGTLHIRGFKVEFAVDGSGYSAA